MSANKLFTSKEASGLTIPELVVIISVTGILGIAFFGGISNFFALMSRNNAANDLTNSSQNLLRSTVETLRVGGGVRQTNTISDANAPVGGWNTSNENFVIIIASPAVDSTREYIIDPQTGSPYMNELVYFKEGGKLMRRTLAHPDAAGNSQITSCPESLASPACPADKMLAEYVQDMIFTLYDQDNNSTSDPTAAYSIKIDLAMERDVAGEPLSLGNSIRVTLRNRF